MSEQQELNSAGEQRLLTKANVAQLFEVTTRTIEIWMGQGLPYLKIGRVVRFRQRDIDDYLEAHHRVVRYARKHRSH